MPERAVQVERDNRAPAILLSTVAFGVGTVAVRLLGFVTSVVVARHYGAVEFAAYSFATSCLALQMVLADAGTETILVRELSRDARQRRELLRALVPTRIALALAVVAGGVVVLSVAGYAPDYRSCALLASLVLPLVAVRGAAEAPFRAALQLCLPAVLRSLTAVLFLGTALAVSRFGGSLVQILALSPMSYAISLAGLLRALPAVRHEARPPEDPPMGLLGMVSAGWPIGANAAAAEAARRAGIVILARIGGPAAVARYGASSRLGEAVGLLPAIAMTSVFSLFSRYAGADPARAGRWFDLTLRCLLATIVPVAVVLSAHAGPLLHWVYGAQFPVSAWSLRLLAWTAVPSSFLAVGMGWLNARNQQMLSLRAGAVVALGTVALSFAMVPMAAEEGAAAALFSATAAGAWLLYEWVAPSLKEWLPTSLGRLGVCGICQALVLVSLEQHRWAGISLGFLVFGTLVLLLGVLRPSDFAALRARGRRPT